MLLLFGALCCLCNLPAPVVVLLFLFCVCCFLLLLRLLFGSPTVEPYCRFCLTFQNVKNIFLYPKKSHPLGPDRQFPRDVPTSNFEDGVGISMFDLLDQTSKFKVGVWTSMFDVPPSLGQTPTVFSFFFVFYFFHAKLRSLDDVRSSG